MAKGNSLVDASDAPPRPSKRVIGDYDVTDAISTLTRAERIKTDKALMREVTKTMAKVASITPAPRKRR